MKCVVAIFVHNFHVLTTVCMPDGIVVRDSFFPLDWLLAVGTIPALFGKLLGLLVVL
jgi:hypothetical protein